MQLGGGHVAWCRRVSLPLFLCPTHTLYSRSNARLLAILRRSSTRVSFPLLKLRCSRHGRYLRDVPSTAHGIPVSKFYKCIGASDCRDRRRRVLGLGDAYFFDPMAHETAQHRALNVDEIHGDPWSPALLLLYTAEKGYDRPR